MLTIGLLVLLVWMHDCGVELGAIYLPWRNLGCLGLRLGETNLNPWFYGDVYQTWFGFPFAIYYKWRGNLGVHVRWHVTRKHFSRITHGQYPDSVRFMLILLVLGLSGCQDNFCFVVHEKRLLRDGDSIAMHWVQPCPKRMIDSMIGANR